MKKIFIALFGLLILTSFQEINVSTTECQIKEFYKVAKLDKDAKMLTSSGYLENPELILVPTEVDRGTFEVIITRKGRNLYKVEGKDYYIETKYCTKYATREKAILKVESNYGFNRGTLIFNPKKL